MNLVKRNPHKHAGLAKRSEVQAELIRKHFESHNTITRREALDLYGIWNLSNVIGKVSCWLNIDTMYDEDNDYECVYVRNDLW